MFLFFFCIKLGLGEALHQLECFDLHLVFFLQFCIKIFSFYFYAFGTQVPSVRVPCQFSEVYFV